MENLEQEANYFHYCLFRCPAPERLINLYVQFNGEHSQNSRFDLNETRTIATIVRMRLDAVGIEHWLRRQGLRHLLSRKLLLIMYIAECDSMHPDFRVCVSGAVCGYMAVVSALVTGVKHLVVGRIQIALYALL